MVVGSGALELIEDWLDATNRHGAIQVIRGVQSGVHLSAGVDQGGQGEPLVENITSDERDQRRSW